MFETIDQVRGRVREIVAEQARLAQELMLLVRAAEDRGFCEQDGCASSAAWLALVSSSDFRTAARITRTGAALRELPELDRALETGELTLDQVVAAAEFATPATDAELARVAVGKAPREVGRVARTLTPPKVADDQALHARRSLSMVWTRGNRELVVNGRLPLEHGAIFQQTICDIAEAQRAADKEHGVVDEWQRSCADALLTLAQSRGAGGDVVRSRTTLIVHVSEDEPPFIEGAGPVSDETAERLTCNARRLLIRRHGRDLVHSRVGRCASYAQLRALHKRSKHCQYPGCTAMRGLEAHHIVHDAHGGRTELDNLILLCARHHKRLHDRRIRTSGRGEAPVFTDAGGRPITVGQAHAPPG